MTEERVVRVGWALFEVILQQAKQAVPFTCGWSRFGVAMTRYEAPGKKLLHLGGENLIVWSMVRRSDIAPWLDIREATKADLCFCIWRILDQSALRLVGMRALHEKLENHYAQCEGQTAA